MRAKYNRIQGALRIQLGSKEQMSEGARSKGDFVKGATIFGPPCRGSLQNIFFSEVKQYDIAADSTLPSVSKKRKHDDVDQSPAVTPKKIKSEPVEGVYSAQFLCICEKQNTVQGCFALDDP